jgi:hypothetical protein
MIKKWPVYIPPIGIITNISKGWSAYEAWLQKEQEASAKMEIDQLIEDLLNESLKYHDKYSSNVEDFISVDEETSKSYRRRLCKSRKARIQAKKSSKLSLFSRFHPGGKF